MKLRHVTRLPQAYAIEAAPGGLVNVWLCRQIDSYQTPDGQWEYDVDVRVVPGVQRTPGMESDIRERFEAWWAEAAPPNDT